jgi:uncharacterized protein YkwD/uncharacterized membrane protein
MKKYSIMKWKLLALVLAALVALCAIQGRASALELRIRNDFDKKMSAAVVYFDSQSQKWRTQGWFNAEPRSERKVSLNASKTDVYIYAELAGATTAWGNGSITRAVISKGFSYFDGEVCPSGANRKNVKFTKYTAKNNVVEFRPKASASGASSLELRVRNDFEKKMDVAVIYFDAKAKRWRTIGWYSVEPRGERKLSFSTSRSDVYIHAQVSGLNKTWGNGDATKTVTGSAFSYLDGETCPPGTNRRSVKFTKYTANNNVVEFRPKSSTSDIPLKTAGDKPTQTPGGGSASADEFKTSAAELLKLINSDRAKVGAPALRLDDTMQKAANRRASEITRKYSHDRPDGRSYSTVFAEFNLAPRMSAENIAWRSGKGNTGMAAFNKAFMDSPGHRVNMLNRDYSIVGLGFAKAGDKYFVVELFAGNSSAGSQKSLSESLKELERSVRDLRDIF